MLARVLASANLKLIGTHSSPDGTKTAKVYRNADYNEYQVKHFTGTQHDPVADYFTDDKQDAHDTAKHWVGL